MSGFERYESSQSQSRQQHEQQLQYDQQQQQQQYYVGDHNSAMNMAPAQSYPSLSAGQGHPPPMLLGGDESMTMARIEKDLPSVPAHEGDESTFNDYASSQVFYPPPQEFPTYGHNQEYEYQNTNQQSYMPYSGEQAAYHSKPYVEDPLVLQHQMQNNTLHQPIQSQPRRLSKLERDNFEPYKRRNFCCCFRRRGHCILFFLSIFVVFLVLLFLALPFQFFSFDASDPFLPSTSTSGLNIASRNPLSLSFTIGENITVSSPSYFTWGVHQLTVNMQLKDAKGDLIPGVNGVGFQKDLRFPARSSTSFTLVSRLLTW